MIVQDVIDLVREQTRDLSGVTWTDDDIILHVNQAQHNIIQRDPSANSVVDLIPVVAGIAQNCPDETIALSTVICNIESDGTTLSDTISEVDVNQKSAFSPGWRSTRPAAKITEFMRRNEPTEFFVYPPLSVDTVVLAERSIEATPCTNPDSVIDLQEQYEEPINNFVLYRCYSRDSEDSPNLKRALDYKNQFEAFFK